MKKILKVAHPNVYAEYVGAPILHPQLALISYDEVSPFRSSLNDYGVYGLFIQQQFPKYLSYGTHYRGRQVHRRSGTGTDRRG